MPLAAIGNRWLCDACPFRLSIPPCPFRPFRPSIPPLRCMSIPPIPPLRCMSIPRFRVSIPRFRVSIPRAMHVHSATFQGRILARSLDFLTDQRSRPRSRIAGSSEGRRCGGRGSACRMPVLAVHTRRSSQAADRLCEPENDFGSVPEETLSVGYWGSWRRGIIVRFFPNGTCDTARRRGGLAKWSDVRLEY